jgi:hypothetical protein
MEARYARLSAEGTRGAALKDLRGRFAAAIAGADVPLAHDLLRLLDEWPVADDAEAVALARELRPRLRRHSRALRDREATRGYFVRAFEQPLWDAVVAPGPRWMLHLHAPGGRGKTMFTRNLLGRWCPEHDVPVARIDFDFVTQLAVTTAEPWRLLLDIAAQLAPQLPDFPFEHLLAEYGELDASVRPEALPPVRPAERVDPLRPVDEQAVDAALNLAGRFASELARAVGTAPVVIVLDTVENTLHTPGADLAPVLDAFGGIVAAAPGVRVVLSGRFDITADRPGARPRVAGFRDRWVEPTATAVSFGDAPAQVGASITWMELPGFTSGEATAFLAQRWPLPDPDVVAAIAARAGDNPMKLDLLGEYATRTPGVTPAAIAAIEEVDLFYLVDRVVDRIPDTAVQWLLRWGALLPVLTRDAVEQVLWPALDAFAAQQESRYDDTSTDPLPAPAPEVSRWAPPRLADVRRPGAAAAAWDGLLDYASGASWVSVAEDLPDAVTFHPEVRDPLRQLLRRGGRPVHNDIHRRAFAHWLRLADTPGPEQRAARSAALFHAYQPWSGDHDGDRLFDRFVAEAGEDRELRAALAREVVAAARGTATLAAEAAAHLELAEFLAAEAIRQGRPVRDAALAYHLEQAGPAADRHRTEFLRAVLADAAGEPVTAWAHLAEALGHRPPGADPHLALVAMWAGTRTPPMEALGTARRLDELCAGLPLTAGPASALARGLLAAERWTAAVDAARRAGDTELRCAGLIGGGWPERVLDDGSSPREWRARAYLLMCDADRALDELGTGKRTKSAPRPTPAEMLLRGIALAQLDRVDEAVAELSQAAAGADPAVSAAASMELARTAHGSGQSSVATSYLSRLMAAADPLVAVRATLLAALHLRFDDHERARMQMDMAEVRVRRGLAVPPSLDVALAVTRIAVEGEAAGEAPSALLRALVGVDGERARLVALRDLAEVPTAVPGITPSVADGLRTLTAPSPDCPSALLLARAELQRVLGDLDAGRDLLDVIEVAPLIPSLARAVGGARERLASAPGQRARAVESPLGLMMVNAELTADNLDLLITYIGPTGGRFESAYPQPKGDLGLAALVRIAVSPHFTAMLDAAASDDRRVLLLLSSEVAARLPWEYVALEHGPWRHDITFIRVASATAASPGVARDVEAVAAESVHVVVLDPRRDRGTVPDLVRKAFAGRVPVTVAPSGVDPSSSTSPGDDWPAGHVLHIVAAPLERRRSPGLLTATGDLLTAEMLLAGLGPGPRLIVLDLALTGSDDEAERQLMTANAFCWQLTAQNADVDVLCGVFGGANDGTGRLLRLVNHLVARRRLGEIIDDLQHAGPVLPGGRSPLRDIVSLSSAVPNRRYLLEESR